MAIRTTRSARSVGRTGICTPVSSGANLLGDIAANGRAGVYCSRKDESDVESVISDHSYAIISLGLDGNGDGIPDTVTLYNPHRLDQVLLYNLDGTPMLDADGKPKRGCTDGSDDGYVTLSIDQFTHDAQNPIGAYTADYNRYL